MSESTLQPSLEVVHDAPARCVLLRGRWNVQGLSAGTGGASARRRIDALKAQLLLQGRSADTAWNLTHATAMDHVGALMLWQAWGGCEPKNLILDPRHRMLFENFRHMQAIPADAVRFDPFGALVAIGTEIQRFIEHLSGFVRLLGQVVLDLGRFAARPQAGPWREISANLYRSGAQALGITALVGFLIGIVLFTCRPSS